MTLYDCDSVSILEFLPRDRLPRAATINVGYGLTIQPLQFTLTAIEVERSSRRFDESEALVRLHAEVLERDRGVLVPIEFGELVPLDRLIEDPRGVMKHLLVRMLSHELDEVLLLNGQRNDPHVTGGTR